MSEAWEGSEVPKINTGAEGGARQGGSGGWRRRAGERWGEGAQDQGRGRGEKRRTDRPTDAHSGFSQKRTCYPGPGVYYLGAGPAQAAQMQQLAPGLCFPLRMSFENQINTKIEQIGNV